MEELEVSELLELADELQGLLRGLYGLREKLVSSMFSRYQRQSKLQDAPPSCPIRG